MMNTKESNLSGRMKVKLGMPVLDAQHHEFFRQFDILADADNPHRVKDTLLFLDYYIKRHFHEEERFQGRCGYPKAEEHRRHHRIFARTYAKLKRDYDRYGETPALLDEINKVMVGWLKGHIMILDKEFADFYNGVTARTRGAAEGYRHFSRTVFQRDGMPRPTGETHRRAV